MTALHDTLLQGSLASIDSCTYSLLWQVLCVLVTRCGNVCPAGLTGLKTLWLGSGDHRLGLSTEQLQELGGQWPALDSLRLSGFSPLQGFAGLGAFTGLTALSLKPGVGTGGCCLRVRLLYTLSDQAVYCRHPLEYSIYCFTGVCGGYMLRQSYARDMYS